ncbi:hypothetical protein ABLN86_02905, partial [Mycobacterium tuberculosis]
LTSFVALIWVFNRQTPLCIDFPFPAFIVKRFRVFSCAASSGHWAPGSDFESIRWRLDVWNASAQVSSDVL